MKLKFSYIGRLIVILVFFSYHAAAQESNIVLSDFFTRLEQNEKRINTIRAEFIQTVFFESTSEKQKIAGTIFLKKPNNVYITQTTPQEQRIYISGKTVTVYTPNERQVIVDSWKNSVSENFSFVSAINFGCSWQDMKKTNSITLDGYDDNCVVIKIQSFKNKNFNLKIYISETSMLTEKFVMNSEDMKIEVVFKNYIINSKLAADTFSFKVPNGVEVIKL